MKVKINTDNVELSNKYGSYHFSLNEYTRVGEDKAKEIAEKEIQKKLKDSEV